MSKTTLWVSKEFRDELMKLKIDNYSDDVEALLRKILNFYKQNKVEVEIRQCPQCNETFELNNKNFYVSTRKENKISYRSICITCFNLNRYNPKNENISLELVATCSKCNIEKPQTDFYKDKYAPGGYRRHCKDCNKLYDKKRRKSIGFNQLMEEKRREENDIKN